jgi:hypothetical protein
VGGGLPRAIDVLDDVVWISNGDEKGSDRGWVTAVRAGTTEVLEEKLEVGGSPEGLGASATELWVATGSGQEAKAITP